MEITEWVIVIPKKGIRNALCQIHAKHEILPNGFYLWSLTNKSCENMIKYLWKHKVKFLPRVRLYGDKMMSLDFFSFHFPIKME